MNTLQTVSMVASALVSIVVAVVAIAALPAIWSLRKTFLHIQESVDKLQADVGPLLRHATSVAQNVDHATATITADVNDVSLTVREANERARQVLVATERGLREFNAFLRHFQGEGESLFLSAASAVRGIRSGAAAFRRRRKRRATDLSSIAPDEIERDVQLDRHEEEDDVGDKRFPEKTGRAPRVRPRRQSQRPV